MLPKPSVPLVAVVEVHGEKSVPPRSTNGSCSSGRCCVEHRLHVSRCTEHARRASGQGWSRLPVLWRSAHRLGILKRSNLMPVPAPRFCRTSLVPQAQLRACVPPRGSCTFAFIKTPVPEALFPKFSVLSVCHGSSNASTQPFVRADAQRQAVTGPHSNLGLAHPAVVRRSS